MRSSAPSSLSRPAPRLYLTAGRPMTERNLRERALFVSDYAPRRLAIVAGSPSRIIRRRNNGGDNNYNNDNGTQFIIIRRREQRRPFMAARPHPLSALAASP